MVLAQKQKHRQMEQESPKINAPVDNNPPAMQKTWVEKIPWRRIRQPTPVFLPGESPWTEEPGGLQFMGPQSVRHD